MLAEIDATAATREEAVVRSAQSHWYLIHTKPRQECRALENLEQQGYTCFLPLFLSEKLFKGRLLFIEEPLFPRYLFIRLATGMDAKSWAPIRSTNGVSSLVRFGDSPARVDDGIIDLIRRHELEIKGSPERLFNEGDRLQVVDGPFSGMGVVFEMADGENRAMVLIELLGKLTRLTLRPSDLKKVVI